MIISGAKEYDIDRWAKDLEKKYLLKVKTHEDGTTSIVSKKRGLGTFFDRLLNSKSYDLEEIEKASKNIQNDRYFIKLGEKIKTHNGTVQARIQNYPTLATIFQWKRIEDFSDMGKFFLRQKDYTTAHVYFFNHPDNISSVDIQAYAKMAYLKDFQTRFRGRSNELDLILKSLSRDRYKECGIAYTALAGSYLKEEETELRKKGLEYLKKAIEHISLDAFIYDEMIQCCSALKEDEKAEVKEFLQGHHLQMLQDISQNNQAATIQDARKTSFKIFFCKVILTMENFPIENGYMNALAILEEVEKVEPRNSSVQMLLGLHALNCPDDQKPRYFSRDDLRLNKAKEYFIKALELDPKNIEAHKNLAECFQRLARESSNKSLLDEAKKQLQMALELCPNDIEIETKLKTIEGSLL